MSEEDEAACVRRDRKGGKLFPGEMVFYDSDPTITIPDKGTAQATAAAFLNELSELYGVEEAKRAFRNAVKSKLGEQGRPKRPDSIAFDAALLQDYHHELAGSGSAEAKTRVAKKFSGQNDPFGGKRTFATVRRRLSTLVAEEQAAAARLKIQQTSGLSPLNTKQDLP